jgi:hypothetical protein
MGGYPVGHFPDPSYIILRDRIQQNQVVIRDIAQASGLTNEKKAE